MLVLQGNIQQILKREVSKMPLDFSHSPVVDVVAPASTLSQVELKRALEFLKKINLTPRFRGSVKNSSLFAQSDRMAFENFKKALQAKDSCLIWSLRGGYGSARLLKSLDALKVHPPIKKLFIGYSDMTVLHDWIHEKFRWPTLHFPVLKKMPFTSVSSINKFKKLVSGLSQVTFSNLQILNKKRFLHKKIISQITGGNMTLIQSAIGTPWNISRKGILFLEDINEKPYQVHRALWQMKQSGVFQNVRAVIFGKWQKEYSKNIIHQVLKPFAKEVLFPVFVELPCGHGRISDPLPLGTRAELSLEKGRGLLQVHSPFLELQED